MIANSNTWKTLTFESCPYLIKLHFWWWGFFIIIQITNFYYQKIQIEILFNSIELNFSKMSQNSSYWEVIWLQLPPVTWHWFGQMSIKG
jgi:hypothetical protein